jgi:hypothetical protein
LWHCTLPWRNTEQLARASTKRLRPPARVVTSGFGQLVAGAGQATPPKANPKQKYWVTCLETIPVDDLCPWVGMIGHDWTGLALVSTCATIATTRLTTASKDREANWAHEHGYGRELFFFFLFSCAVRYGTASIALCGIATEILGDGLTSPAFGESAWKYWPFALDTQNKVALGRCICAS